MPITRGELKASATEYHEHVRLYEISLFVAHLCRSIQVQARNGNLRHVHPVLKPFDLLIRNPQGLIEKDNPGPIQRDFLPGVMNGLTEFFPGISLYIDDPDTNLYLEKSYLIMEWS